MFRGRPLFESFRANFERGVGVRITAQYNAFNVSYKIANAVGDKAGYVRNMGLDEKILKELIISALQNGLLEKTEF
mgnify:CR=1 FL=1